MPDLAPCMKWEKFVVGEIQLLEVNPALMTVDLLVAGIPDFKLSNICNN